MLYEEEDTYKRHGARERESEREKLEWNEGMEEG